MPSGQRLTAWRGVRADLSVSAGWPETFRLGGAAYGAATRTTEQEERPTKPQKATTSRPQTRAVDRVSSGRAVARSPGLEGLDHRHRRKTHPRTSPRQAESLRPPGEDDNDRLPVRRNRPATGQLSWVGPSISTSALLLTAKDSRWEPGGQRLTAWWGGVRSRNTNRQTGRETHQAAEDGHEQERGTTATGRADRRGLADATSGIVNYRCLLCPVRPWWSASSPASPPR
ncbi:hypothetical protein STSO111631_11630 [Stackebrandtia soli]